MWPLLTQPAPVCHSQEPIASEIFPSLSISLPPRSCFWIRWLTSTCIRIRHHLQGLQPLSPPVMRRLPLSVSKQPWLSAKNLRQRQSLTDRGTSVSLTAFPAFKVGERGKISVLDPNCSPYRVTLRNAAIMCQMGNFDKLNVQFPVDACFLVASPDLELNLKWLTLKEWQKEDSKVSYKWLWTHCHS